MTVFGGFIRDDGRVGIRNHVLILPTVSCANGVVHMVRRAVPQSTCVFHCHGCGRGGQDLQVHLRTLSNLGRNPNVCASVVIGLGCETVKADWVASAIAESGKPVECVEIQSEGGSRRAAERAADIARCFIRDAARLERAECGVDRLVVGLECGGSDAFSGITANPVVGIAADWLVSEGGTVILTENTEMIGTEHILSERACSEEVAGEVRRVVRRAREKAEEILGPLANMVIAPGNMDGGMSTITEKSLGCITKGGSSSIKQVVPYAEPPSEKGLVIMDGPGYDTESMAGLAAAGAQVILFTTGRGTPAGFPIVPVMKIASNSKLFDCMEDDMDINAGTVIEGEALEDAASRLRDKLLSVLEGEKTKAETNSLDGVVCLYTSLPPF